MTKTTDAIGGRDDWRHTLLSTLEGGGVLGNLWSVWMKMGSNSSLSRPSHGEAVAAATADPFSGNTTESAAGDKEGRSQRRTHTHTLDTHTQYTHSTHTRHTHTVHTQYTHTQYTHRRHTHRQVCGEQL